ncbi:uncharacterized protein LOC110812740 isoform X2 [Carica papaya]|uniref:uncharacterized protein LOC110812740 isoform X2 n=1 Tax=Carica papaya TaxID=3649 RepID=UPI000B8CA483|nr:uncharacterized protein LOC110812740 isoform X2 [Carica papaya]
MDLLNPSRGYDHDQKLHKAFSMDVGKPLMLKDYLLQDLTSCSSNGFNSFPRRQCCTTVRFLLDIDLRKTNTANRFLTRSRSRAVASTTISAFRRASEAVIKAIKSTSPSPSVRDRVKKVLLPRSLSRKLLKGRFWKKADGGIKKWRLFRELSRKSQQTFDQNAHQFATTTTTIITTIGVSTSNSCREYESEIFTWDTLLSSSSNSGSPNQNDTVEGKKELTEKKLIGEDSTSKNSNRKEWPNEEKEQSSPVSVLDSPFEDVEEFNSPQSRYCRPALVKGTRQKLIQKTRYFEGLTHEVEPVDLEKRIASLELNDEHSTKPTSSFMSMNQTYEHVNDNEREAYHLLNLIKARNPLNSFLPKEDSLLLDLVGERLLKENHAILGKRKELFKEELLKTAEDWIKGQPRELFLGWDMKANRGAYFRDVEKNGSWRNFDDEIENMAQELELDFLTSLVDELLLDLL